jgi:L-2-hydroxycarboxylate dehydrogenase (NAD+)
MTEGNLDVREIRVGREPLEQFCQAVFQTLNVPEEDARIAAAVLVAANARGIPSHGVARLQRYINGLETGLMLP